MPKQEDSAFQRKIAEIVSVISWTNESKIRKQNIETGANTEEYR